jgi:predicted secreted protein
LTDGMGQVVDDIFSGRYNMEQVQKSVVNMEQMKEYLMLARTGDTNSVRAGRVLLAIRSHDPAALCDLASQIATDRYIVYRDTALANEALDRAVSLGATNLTDIAVDRAILLFQIGKREEGLARAEEALAAAKTPDDRDEAQTCIHAMQVKMAEANPSPTNAPTAGP